MGISGLLPLLKSIQKPCNLKKFAGQVIGIDAYGWLHRGTVACAVELATGKPTTKHIDFAMNRVRMLIHFGVIPYLVFDGDYLPSKAGTEKERSQKRKDAKKLGLELLKLGKTSQAHNELQKAVDVTPEMARVFIEELKKANVQYVVAPYEADSQLAYLEREGIIQAILSEDSDLLVFGAKCLLTKLDQYGECIMIRRQDFTACREVSLVGWTDAEFRRMAILSGCDYLDSINKMGLKTAYRLIRRHKTAERVIRALQFDGKFKVPDGYLEAFQQAELTFLYQWVFCPRSKRLVHLTQRPEDLSLDDMPFIGRFVAADIAIGVSKGDLNPHTKEPIILNPVDARSFGPRFRAARNVVQEIPADPKMKPIDSFFNKPTRVPLQELDPNCFQPTQSQQRILEGRREPWPARPAPRLLTTQSAATSSTPSRRSLSDSLRNSNTTPHPAKRQRLCAEPNLDASPGSSAKVESGKSRFFSSSTPAKANDDSVDSAKTRRKSLDEFNLWSDDSFEEAMAAMDSSIPKPRRKMPVFSEKPGVHTASPKTEDEESEESQLSILSNESTESKLTAGTLTPATSCGSPSTSFEDSTIFSQHISKGLSSFSEKFAYQPSPRDWAKDLKVGTPSFHTRRRVKTTPAFGLTSSSQPLSASKRLSIPSPSVKPVSSFSKQNQSQPSKKEVDAKDISDLDDSVWAAHESSIIVSQSSPETSPAKDLKKEMTSVRGSEDMLVPASEDDISEVEDDVPPKGRKLGFGTLDLGKFAFTG